MTGERAAAQSNGAAVEILETVDLARLLEGMARHRLRMRMVTIDPEGVFGLIHDDVRRPGIGYVLQRTIIDHRDGIATDYGPGAGGPEDRSTGHGLEDRGSEAGGRELGGHRRASVVGLGIVR